MHKKYTLLKAGLLVAPNGFILDVYGPYFADMHNNDANILMHDMRNENRAQIQHWIRNGDILITDRGYRDASAFLQDLGLLHEMPEFLPRNQRQFTTAEANHNRLITKTRWIVESRNGHIKSIFKFFQNMIHIQHCEYLGNC